MPEEGTWNARALARAASAVENGAPSPLNGGHGLLVGITGPPGAGKSSLVDALAREIRREQKTVAIIAVDPSSRSTGGAILGDRIRMQQHHADSGIFIRSMATRGTVGGLARTTREMTKLFRGAGFDFVLVETVGVGQDEIAIARLADVTVVVVVPGMGDDVQAIKAGILEVADVFVINKADRPGVEQTKRELQAEWRAPVIETIATAPSGVAELLTAIRSVPRKAPTLAVEFEIDHLGIAVKSLDTALRFYEGSLGMAALPREEVAQEKVAVSLLPAGESRIELLEPSAPDSVIARFLEKRGEGLHHVALRVPDLEATLKNLKASGARILGEPQHGAGGHLYVFVHPASTGGVLLELIQK